MTAPKAVLWLPAAFPWIPPAHDDSIVMAVKALQQGKASETQQQLFWRYLMHVTGASEEFADLSFRPEGMGGERDSVFAEGKRFVGLMIRKLLRPEFTPKPISPEKPRTIQKRMRQNRSRAAA